MRDVINIQYELLYVFVFNLFVPLQLLVRGAIMSMSKQNIRIRTNLTVPFHGNELYIIEHNGEPYTPMRPIVAGMGLDWKSQFTKLKQRFNSTVVEITIVAKDGKERLMTCLPVRKLAAWLYSVSPNKVRPELREIVIMYQNECDDVLWEHWTKKANKRQQAHDELNQLYLEEQISQAKGSFHGLGLWKRKKEKILLKSKIRCCELYLQPSFLMEE